MKRALEVAVAIGIIALIQAGVVFYNGRVSDSIARHGQQLTAHGLELTAEGLLLTAHGQQLTACESPTVRGQLTRDNLAKCRAALNHTVGELPAPTPDRVGGHAARNVVVPTTLKRIT